MEGKTNFSRRMKQFDGVIWLTLTSIFYDSHRIKSVIITILGI